MKLTFQSSLLSIKEFPEVDLPAFTLITGLNGTGKSHLLRALLEQKIKCDAVGNISEIRFFDWTNMVPSDSGYYDGHSAIQERTNIFEQVNARRKNDEDQIIATARANGLRGAILNDVTEIARLSLDDLRGLLNNEESAKKARDEIGNAVSAVSQNMLGSIAGNLRQQIALITQEAGRPLAALKRRDFFESRTVPSWGTATIFQHSFGQLFVAYRDLKLGNSVRRFARSEGQDVFALTDEEFFRQHMGPPWDFVNDSLRTAGLDFQINKPDEYDFSPYQPKLTKLSSNADVNFGDLSSGEKVLMSFALCLYYANDRRQITTYPKLLLLDEIDAPLHPSMSRGLIKTITSTLVEQNGIKVIATTHSPSTVALAPEESLYAMKAGEPGLHKMSKAQALNILTDGVPTLAISYEGRRQVLVESPIDAEVYSTAYDIARPFLKSERSLEFVAPGFSGSTGDVNTGCAVVRRLVSELSRAGNTSVFGLVDWDGSVNPSERVCVLAHGQRNGLENVILDPLVVAALVAKDARGLLPRINLPGNLAYIKFVMDASLWQAAADGVQAQVLGNGNKVAVSCAYNGGFSLSLDSRYLRMDDHELEARVVAAFPPLAAIARRSGALMRHIAQTVLRDKPEFLPLGLLDSFREVLGREGHR